MHLNVQSGLSPTKMNHIRRHGRVRWNEEGRLIHIRPDACNAGIKQCPVLLSPPRSRLRGGKVGKDTDARPDGVLIIVSLGHLTIEIALFSFGVNPVIFVDLHSSIDNAYHVEAHLAKFREQLLGIREAGAVPGKYSIAIQAVDIEVQRIARDITLTKCPRNLPHLFRGFIAEPALPIAQRPERGKRRIASQVGVAYQNILGRRATKHIVHEVSIARTKPRPLRGLMTQIELAARGTIKKEAPRLPISQRQGKWNRNIQVIL